MKEIERRLWSRKRFANTAAEICEFAVDYYRYGRKDGTAKGFCWQDKKGKDAQEAAAWKELQVASHVIACMAAQHILEADGVGTDEPFNALQMWKDMDERKRRTLAGKFYDQIKENP